MLTILIYLATLIRRTLRKLLGGISIVAQSFREAQDLRRALPRHYMEE